MEHVHELKIIDPFFAQVISGKKTFEIRKNDRNYHEGDILVLKQFYPKNNDFTGRLTVMKITYVTDYDQKPGYVVLGIEDADHQDFCWYIEQVVFCKRT
jgi:hypothetical protein